MGEQFFDPTYNNHTWDEELRTHMMAAFNMGTQGSGVRG